jgi:hypothetical protein
MKKNDSSSTKNPLGIPIVAVGIAVVSVALGLGGLVAVGLPGVVVLLVFLLAGTMAYFGYRIHSAATSKILFAGSLIFVLFGLRLTAYPLWTVTPAPPEISISAERQTDVCTPRGYVFPGSATNLPPPIDPSDPDFVKDWSLWGIHNNAADADRTSVLLNVGSSDHRMITLTSLSVIVTQRKTPKRIVVHNGSNCGGPTQARYIEYDLDAQPPKITDSSRIVRYVGQPGLEITPLTFPYTVTDEDTASILIIGDAYSCDCSWHAELSWQAGSTHGVKEIDLEGQPFRTAGTNGLDGYESFGGRWQSEPKVGKASSSS